MTVPWRYGEPGSVQRAQDESDTALGKDFYADLFNGQPESSPFLYRNMRSASLTESLYDPVWSAQL